MENKVTIDPSKVGKYHMAVNCVILGFDKNELNVMLGKRKFVVDGNTVSDYILPGTLMHASESLDDTIQRVLTERLGLNGIRKFQIKTYSANECPVKRNDVEWVKQQIGTEIDTPISIAYLSGGKIGRKLNLQNALEGYEWYPINKAMEMPLAFNQTTMISDAMEFLRYHIEIEPLIVFNLLPSKFTALQLRTLYECIFGKTLDVRNFTKKMKQYEYVVPLDEVEKGVAHRAARYYRFDRVKYKRFRRGI
ncbi:MAG: DNA mismatch repair protein MutT [Bacteroidales bacterium]|nr:DNA mismatch repair protein MutT [Candidatus Sodaliphilus aphodohippi]